MRPQQALPMQGDHDSNHTWDGCAQVDASSRAPPGTGGNVMLVIIMASSSTPRLPGLIGCLPP
jgi:hypothetical protein